MSFFGVSTIDEINSDARLLSYYLFQLKAILEDAETQQITDPSLKEVLQLSKDVEYMLKDTIAEVAINSNLLKDISAFNPKNIILRHNMGKRVNEATSRFNEFRKRCSRLIPEEFLIPNEVAGQTSSIQRRHRRDGSEIEPINQTAEIVSTNRRSNHLSKATWQNYFNAEDIWRQVGLVSSLIGLPCYALSPSFNRLFGTRKPFKLIGYVVLSLALVTTILFAEKSPPSSTRHDKLKIYTSFAVLMILSVYTFFYDSSVNGKPGILNVVSNAAFVLVSLSVKKLFNFGFESGVFTYFLGCFAVQLFTMHWMLILVAIVLGYPLFKLHSQPEVTSHSSSNSRLHVGSDDQDDIDNIDFLNQL